MKLFCAALAFLGCIVCGSAYASRQAEEKRPVSVPASLALTQTGSIGSATKPPPSYSGNATSKPRPAISRNAKLAPDSAIRSLRANAPVVTVTGVGPGQEGYVHFFITRFPSGDEETQIGIELPDQRIAWSFPELGVIVSPFIKAGVVQANAGQYEVNHLYGFRPFADDESMRRLQAQLLTRVTLWVEDATPHCNIQGPLPPGYFCISCLGFALRVLFPGPTPEYSMLPRDFPRASRDTYYTTEDLLFYLVGLHTLRGKAAQLKRIDQLALPENLREEALRLVNAAALNETVAAEESRPGTRPTPKNGPQRKRAS